MTDTSDDLKRHCFPDLSGEPSEQGSEGCSLFQPLYRSDINSPNRLVACEFNGDSASDQEESEEFELQRSYRRGFDAGKQAACTLVQDELAPHLVHFENELDMMTQSLQQLLANAGPAIHTLALSIAEKILCQKVTIRNGDSRNLCNHLKKTLLSAYRMELILNPGDLELFNGLTNRQDMTGLESSLLPITCHIDVQKGTLEQRKEMLPMTAEQAATIVQTSEPKPAKGNRVMPDQ